MKNIKHILVAAALAVSLPLTSLADEAGDKIRDRLEGLLQGHKVESIQPAPLGGFYEAVVDGELFYLSADARYLFQGDLFDLENGVKNLTEERTGQIRKSAMDTISDDKVISFGPEDADYTLTVFTDIDCGYCRKLHGEMDQYNAKGIRIRYMFFPRSGPGTESFQKAVWVWCADDRQQAMTAAKRGDKIEQRECENPVLDHYTLGRKLGVTGTPALVLESGRMLPGYIPAERLRTMLDELAKEG